MSGHFTCATGLDHDLIKPISLPARARTEAAVSRKNCLLEAETSSDRSEHHAVTRSSQTLPAQDLRTASESVRSIKIGLFFSHACHFSLSKTSTPIAVHETFVHVSIRTSCILSLFLSPSMFLPISWTSLPCVAFSVCQFSAFFSFSLTHIIQHKCENLSNYEIKKCQSEGNTLTDDVTFVTL